VVNGHAVPARDARRAVLDALEFCRHVSHPSPRNPLFSSSSSSSSFYPPSSSMSPPALPLACLYHNNHKQSGKGFILPLRHRLANCEGSLCVCVCVCVFVRVSACVHALVPHKRLQRVVPLDRPRSLAVLTTGVTLTNTQTQYLRLDVPRRHQAIPDLSLSPLSPPLFPHRLVETPIPSFAKIQVRMLIEKNPISIA
jgi:hypothetical protein